MVMMRVKGSARRVSQNEPGETKVHVPLVGGMTTPRSKGVSVDTSFMGSLTVRDEEEEADDSDRHGDDVDQEVPVVVDRDAVVDPWAVAAAVSHV